MAAAVRMEDHARDVPAARGDGHPQRGADERRPQMIGDGPADHAAREHVEHRRQVPPALPRADVMSPSHSNVGRRPVNWPFTPI
jgi:hypothetical protein